MPDGKRSSIPSEGETGGENCFYDEDLQHDGLTKKLPVNLQSRGFQNLSDRLLRAMVANEVKKTLDSEDNKKLVAHHRPVLHSENDNNESEMFVVSVVLNAKQTKNDEVSKAIDMLRRNGVTCVCFTLKDTPTSNGTKKGEGQSLSEDIIKSMQENYVLPGSPEPSEPSTKLENKVSSPTVSTTSDYTTKTDSRKGTSNIESDSCTSTTPTVITAGTQNFDAEVATHETNDLDTNKTKDIQNSEIYSLPTLSPSPPVLFPQISVVEGKGPLEYQSLRPQPESDSLVVEKSVNAAALRRKRRRKRLYPYVSRRKAKNKRKKQSLPKLKDESIFGYSELSKLETVPDLPEQALSVHEVETNSADLAAGPVTTDPYEFEDSDTDNHQRKKSKTSAGPKSKKVTIRKATPQNVVLSTPCSPPITIAVKSRGKKGSPRKRLSFSSLRAFSPDITDHGIFRNEQPQPSQAEGNTEDVHSPLESCVQSISISKRKVTGTKLVKVSTDVSMAPRIINDDPKLVLPDGQCQLLKNRDEVIRAEPSSLSNKPNKLTPEVQVPQRDNDEKNESQSASVAQKSSNVQTPEVPLHAVGKDGKPLLQEPNDSLQNTPDSMQLRRSSFYSTISRNVRTNLEKYLDGRPFDLKAPKRSKKIKNGFLLHHGDNFPDNPEEPYRLNLATQVLLKLNKRRAKCKPKDDKGKSLLSYLKLQPKRVSRVSKHSKHVEDVEASSASEATSVFSGDWTVSRKFICNICGQVENAFWDMVMHKGEIHPGIVVTHVELSDSPPEGFRHPPSPRHTTTIPNPPPCSKCAATFNAYSDLHRHIFECAGNASLLEDTTTKVARKKKAKRKRGFKRRISGLPKKNNSNGSIKSATSTPAKSGEITKRRYSEVFKCEFCTREFKTEGWLKNHISLSHSLPISIPLDKLSLPSRASISSSRRFTTTSQLAKPSNQLSRET